MLRISKSGVVGVLFSLLLFLLLAQAGSSSAQPEGELFRPGVVLVGMHAGVSPARLAQLWSNQGLQPENNLKPLSIVSVRVPMGQEATTAETLRRTGLVTFAELDYAAHATDIITPSDPGWSKQWGPAKIEAPAAWAAITATTDVIIAVIDSGIKLDHEDLVAQRWINTAEIPGNWLDDDGNGEIDDVNGWHFFHRWTGASYVPDQNANVQDDYGHGTHVAGIAAAATNNGVGIAGIAPGARVMPVKVLDQYGNGWYSDIAAGIVYAADNGARVINLSLGGAEDSQTLRDAVDYARSRGALVVAATGNTGGAVLYPAAYDPVLAVAATDANDQVAYFSNRGTQVDVAAPGVDIYSTWPWVTGYFTKSGTSMAAPHVSGIAALLWSCWPVLSGDSIAHTITLTAIDIGDPGWDVDTGWGRVDAYQAVQRVAIIDVFLPLIRR
jgi:subtilisin family serine protease